jgi:hypothetical protein
VFEKGGVEKKAYHVNHFGNPSEKAGNMDVLINKKGLTLTNLQISKSPTF